MSHRTHAATKTKERAQLKVTGGWGDGERAGEGRVGRGKVRLVEEWRGGVEEKYEAEGKVTQR